MIVFLEGKSVGRYGDAPLASHRRKPTWMVWHSSVLLEKLTCVAISGAGDER